MPIIRIFGSENELYNEFAVISFRVFLCTIAPLLFAFRRPAVFFSQSLGKPSALHELVTAADFILSVPLTLILPLLSGVTGAPTRPLLVDVKSPLRRYSACAACSGSLEKRETETGELLFPGIGFAAFLKGFQEKSI